MSKDLTKLWVEKYRPKTLDDYIFQDAKQKRIFENYIKDKSIPHLLFTGVQGCGKTSLSKILVRNLLEEETDSLLINASDETGVDVMREKIKTFITSYALGNYKIVQLEEADYISHSSQAILRQMMEEYSDACRFILTANYENKIIPAIKSRCQHFQFTSFDKEKIFEKLVYILDDENVKFKTKLLDKYITVGYPDIRKIINLLQQNVIDNVLKEPEENDSNDYKIQMLELIEKDDWFSIRKLLCTNVLPHEWELVYRFLYENLNKSSKFSSMELWEEGILTIANHLYKHGISSDPEINAAAMFINLSRIGKK